MEELFSIDDVAKIYQVNKSALRYWETEGLVNAARNQSSRYRQYTIKDIIEIGDIVFYRKLGIALAQLKQINQMSANQMVTVLESKRADLLAEIDILKQTVTKLDTNLSHIEKYRQLQQQHFQIEAPDICYLIDSLISDVEGTQLFIEDSYNSALYFHQDEQQFHSASVTPELEEQQKARLILSAEQAAKKTFVTCLLEMDAVNPQETNLQQQLTKITQEGYQVGEIIFGRYLLAATEEGQGKKEFYKLWVEVIEKKNLRTSRS